MEIEPPPQPEIETSKSVTIETNTTTEITPSENYDAMEKVIVTTNVPSIQEDNYTITATQCDYTGPNGVITITPQAFQLLNANVYTSGIFFKVENNSITRIIMTRGYTPNIQDTTNWYVYSTHQSNQEIPDAITGNITYILNNDNTLKFKLELDLQTEYIDVQLPLNYLHF